MKKSIKNSDKALESTKRFLFSFQVILVCLLFPVLFMVGIKSNKKLPSGNEIKIGRSAQELKSTKNVVVFYKRLSDQNS